MATGRLNVYIHLDSRFIFLSTVAIQILYILVIIFNLFNLDIVIVRQIISFVYLIFLPGFLILGLLKINNINFSEIILYSIALSLSFLMIFGVILNILFYLGIIHNKPFSKLYLILSLLIIISILNILFYISSGSKYYIKLNLDFSIRNLILYSIFPFLSIIGVYSIMYYKCNILILFLFLLLSLIPILIIFNKVKFNFQFIIWIIALSLVLYNSLYGVYMRPTDNIFEFYISNKILNIGFWNPNLPYSLDATLGAAILIPIFSIVFGINIVWVYKIIIPILASFIPVGLFEIFKRNNKDIVAFLASFFYVSMFSYFTWSSITMKMVLAGLFLTILIFTAINDLNNLKKIIFICILSYSLVVSHYGTSYLFLFSVLLSYFIISISSKLFNNLKYFNMYLIRLNYIIYYFVLTIYWYLNLASSVTFSNIILTIKDIIINIISKSIFPKSAPGSKLLFGKFPISLEILKYLYIFSGLLIFIGIIGNIKRIFKNKTINEYDCLSISFFVFLVVPYIFGGVYGTGRIWYTQLIILAPFCFYGWEYLCRYILSRKFKITLVFKSFSLFLLIFMLFNTGFIQEVVLKNNPSASVYVSSDRIKNSGSISEIEYLYRVYLTEYDVCSARWLYEKRDTTLRIFTGYWRMTLFMYLGKEASYYINPIIKPTSKFKNGYIYLRYLNIHYGIITISKSKIKGPGIYASTYNIRKIYSILYRCNKIYTNGGSIIYFK